MKNRERLGSRLGFIMLSAGCAIGCGNVWKFPWMCGQNGGGGFMLVYLACLVLLGLPAIVMEFAVGRASQASPVFMYRKLEKPGHKWGIFGIVCLIGHIALMAFYTVVNATIEFSSIHSQFKILSSTSSGYRGKKTGTAALLGLYQGLLLQPEKCVCL